MQTLNIETRKGTREFIIINGVVVMVRPDGTFKGYRGESVWRLFYIYQIAQDDAKNIVELLGMDNNRNIKHLAHKCEPHVLDIIKKYAPTGIREISDKIGKFRVNSFFNEFDEKMDDDLEYVYTEHEIKYEAGSVVSFMIPSGILVVGLVKESFFEYDVTITLEMAVTIQSDGKNLSFSPICTQNLDKIQKFYLSALLTEPAKIDETLEDAYLQAIGIKESLHPILKFNLELN